ncbi:PP2C family protein-serine/threonine phosphatase [Singulisphaera sp. PoT]|uniref:PP2C family protein-serine/threonine phosphatase n=1 Tax=Singulisphaera sp. PoT TaxID=3411797 RepID=UPI003BF48636
MNQLHRFLGADASRHAHDDTVATAEFSTPSSLTLVSGALKLRAGVISETGHYREQNEDNFYVPGRNSVRFDMPSSSHRSGDIGASSFDTSDVVFIVADGMGGQQAGEQASKMAVELIPKALARRMRPTDLDPRAIQGVIRESVAEANQEILGCSGAVAEFSNMGTTVVLALFRNNRVFVAGIGDSRAYRLRAGVLEQMTKDHSLADALGEAGTISKEEIPHHKFKNVLYLYLGSKDARSGPEDVRVLEAQPGDRFLLASDGLTGVVSDAELTRVLETCDDPQRAARVLVDQALANDSKDNITSLVIHVLGDGAVSK